MATRAEVSDVFKSFMTQPLHGELLKQGDIPEVGAATIKKLTALTEKGGGNFAIDTPQKLMGLFCTFNRNQDEFAAFLEAIDVKTSHARKIAGALHSKTEQFCNDEPYPKAGGATSEGGDKSTSLVAQSFARNQLSTARIHDKGGIVPGLAKKIKTVEARIRTLLKSLGGSGTGTASTLQLLGMYLLMGDADWRDWLEDITAKKYVEDVTAAMLHKAEGICGDKVGSVRKPASGRAARRIPETLKEECEPSPDPVRNLNPELISPNSGGAGRSAGARTASSAVVRPKGGNGQTQMALGVVVLALLAAMYFRFFA